MKLFVIEPGQRRFLGEARFLIVVGRLLRIRLVLYSSTISCAPRGRSPFFFFSATKCLYYAVGGFQRHSSLFSISCTPLILPSSDRLSAFVYMHRPYPGPIHDSADLRAFQHRLRLCGERSIHEHVVDLFGAFRATSFPSWFTASPFFFPFFFDSPELSAASVVSWLLRCAFGAPHACNPDPLPSSPHSVVFFFRRLGFPS